MDNTNPILDVTITDVGVPQLIVPTKTNINYLRLRKKYEISEEARERLNDALRAYEFKPSDWAAWFNTITAALNDSYRLGNIISDDISKRESIPIRFTDESEEDFEERCEIFQERKNKIFFILVTHIH